VKNEPIGVCKVQSVEGRKENKVAVYARIIVTDETGQRFYFNASCFNFDLRREDSASDAVPEIAGSSDDRTKHG
jgi:hypothetical protein